MIILNVAIIEDDFTLSQFLQKKIIHWDPIKMKLLK